jgi:hypothetical protein
MNEYHRIIEENFLTTTLVYLGSLVLLVVSFVLCRLLWVSSCSITSSMSTTLTSGSSNRTSITTTDEESKNKMRLANTMHISVTTNRWLSRWCFYKRCLQSLLIGYCRKSRIGRQLFSLEIDRHICHRLNFIGKGNKRLSTLREHCWTCVKKYSSSVWNGINW